MSSLILRSFNDKSIRQRADGFFSATDMCQASGKLFGNWNKTKEAQDYIALVAEKYYSDQNNTPVESKVGNLGEGGGTWVDRRVALRLAQWISAAFALQVDEWIEELLTRGVVSIALKPIALPPADVRVRDLTYALEFVGIDPQNPRFKQGLQDLYGDILGLARPALTPAIPQDDRWCGVAERAEQLGQPVSLVTSKRAQLGKHVKGLVSEDDRRKENRLCNGTSRAIWVYRVTESLDDAIGSFFEGLV